MSTDSEQPDPDGLAGLVIGVPAARRAAETARLIRRWGGTPLVGPTVEEVEVEDPGPVVEATREVLEAPATWSVHLTGVGTRRWFSIAEGHGLLDPLLAVLSRARLIARGQKSSTALRGYGLQPDWIPAGETSREISEWMSGKVDAGATVALQRHGEPVPGLTGPLEATGARVVELATYRWEIPRDRGPAEQLVGEIAGGRVHALVITSAPQVRNLFRVAENLGSAPKLHNALESRVFLASVGTVASTSLEERGISADLVAQPARLGALLRSLAAAREQILDKSRSPSGAAGR
ncbi:MAG TPA: uroporphyrinogen-III synthase [Actinomycetota bacterium]|nr:uroporphyrinogen-III synthase [Actinomycetota bacterium]